jgi:hypothetical protein
MLRYITRAIMAVISMTLLVGSLSAITFPPDTPAGETPSGKFNAYFTNMYSATGYLDIAPNYAN